MRTQAQSQQRVAVIFSRPALMLGAVLVIGACADSKTPSPTEQPTAPAAKPDLAAPSAAPAKPATEPVAAAPAPKTMRSVEVTDAKIAEGKTLFVACGACHGTEGEGRTGIGPRLNSDSFLAAASDEMLLRTIAEGRMGTTMIPWKGSLKPEQLEAVVAYIRSWNKVEPVELNQGPVTGNADKGEPHFTLICSGCHGRTGAGYQETANGTGIGRKVFLSQVDNGYLRYIIKHGKDQTKMKPFAADSKVAVANLTDEQIEDVIAYLRTSAW